LKNKIELTFLISEGTSNVHSCLILYLKRDLGVGEGLLKIVFCLIIKEGRILWD